MQAGQLCMDDFSSLNACSLLIFGEEEREENWMKQTAATLSLGSRVLPLPVVPRGSHSSSITLRDVSKPSN